MRTVVDDSGAVERWYDTEVEESRQSGLETAVAWQVQEAKQKFSALVQRAIDDGPQMVTKRGEEVVVVLSAREYRRLKGDVPDFKEFLLNGPDLGQLEIERDSRPTRGVEL